MTAKDIEAIAGGLAPVLKAYLDVRLAPLLAELATVKAELATVKAQPKGLQYLGVWTDGESYTRGDCVTRQGGMWVCKVNDCRSIPGADDGAGWQLAVRKGRDGKDARDQNRDRQWTTGRV